MIPKPQLLSLATESGLLPTTVEKDYVLGWVLDGISRHPELSQWIFKGGTCLKKCYFETYRFSEDLDFTVPKNGLYDQEPIKTALLKVSQALTEETGIQFPTDGIEIKESQNKRGNKTFVAKLSYFGPLNRPKYSRGRIKFDLTQDEIIVDGTDLRDISHSYSDAKDPLPKARCYTINEILAEKSRALYERMGTPRDIYDVVNISRNFRETVSPDRARAALKQKFAFKSLPSPTVELIHSMVDPDILRANWTESLGHQLRILPPVEAFINDLKEALSWWIEEKPVSSPAPRISSSTQEQVLPKVRFPGATSGPIETIRFAARNRLRAVITYDGIRRVVEPYSLRRPGTGNLLLYVYEIKRGSGPGGGVKAYKVGNIQRVEPTVESFQPRFIIEL